jgi:hypothetical protein
MDNNPSESDSKSHHSSYSKHPQFFEVNDQHEKIFLLTLFTFHMDNLLPCEEILENISNVQVLVGQASFKATEFYLKIGDTQKVFSIKKCLGGLTEAFKSQVEHQAN